MRIDRKDRYLMSENFFFNPGDSIASEYDFDSAYVAAQIYRKKIERPI